MCVPQGVEHHQFGACLLQGIQVRITSYNVCYTKLLRLITGSAGFIGSALALRLMDRGDEVV